MSIASSPLLAIVGVTASGKSTVAMELARHDRRIELVSVDSMQVYRRMNIGTAKPSQADQAEVHHHVIDVVDACEDFSVSEFQRTAKEAIVDIQSRGGVPVLVGGTGLHLRAVIDDLEIPAQFPDVKAALDSADTGELYARLVELDPGAAERTEPTNRRRIARALEVTIGSGRRFSSYGPGLNTYGPTRFRMVGLRWSRAEIDARIEARYGEQMAAGFLDEVRVLAADSAGISRTARQALGYRQLLGHLAGESTEREALDAAILATRRFARRQERWFRRDPRIRWIDVAEKPMEAFGAVVGEYES